MAKHTEKEPPAVKGVSAAERALAVLTAFRRGDGALSLAELAERTGLIKSTIMRLAVSLQRYRLLARMPDGSYRLDAETLRLGTAYQQAFSLSDHVMPALEQLAAKTGETASFYVRHGRERLCLFRVESVNRIRMHVQPGDTRPMDKSAIAQVLQRYEAGPPGPDDELPLFTSGVTDPHAAALAMPVFGIGELLVGALTISGPVSRLTAARAAERQTGPYRSRAQADSGLRGYAPQDRQAWTQEGLVARRRLNATPFSFILQRHSETHYRLPDAGRTEAVALPSLTRRAAFAALAAAILPRVRQRKLNPSAGRAAPRSRDAVAPPGATDCHFHTYDRRYPAAPGATLLPEDASPDDYRALQQRLGTSRGVIIQPSTYGTDNSLQLASRQALGPENFRVVAVVAEDVPDAELRRLDEQGVRGVRFNLGFPGVLTVASLRPLAPRLAELGWTCQINMRPKQIEDNADLLTSLPGRLVFDHLAQVPQPGGLDSAPYKVVRGLLDRGKTWVKLSGPYVSSKQGPPTYADAGAVAASYVRGSTGADGMGQRLAASFGAEGAKAR